MNISESIVEQGQYVILIKHQFLRIQKCVVEEENIDSDVRWRRKASRTFGNLLQTSSDKNILKNGKTGYHSES